jgi:hypothetical protein
VHVYIMQNWGRMSLLCSLQRMSSTGATTDMLTQILVDALRSNGRLEVLDLGENCFVLVQMEHQHFKATKLEW